MVHTLGNLFTNMSLGKVSVSFTHTVKAMEPFFSVILSSMFLGEVMVATSFMSAFVVGSSKTLFMFGLVFFISFLPGIIWIASYNLGGFVPCSSRWWSCIGINDWGLLQLVRIHGTLLSTNPCCTPYWSQVFFTEFVLSLFFKGGFLECNGFKFIKSIPQCA